MKTNGGLRERLIDPNSPDRRPRRAAYALPTLFTAGNVFLGFYALIEVFQGSMAMQAGTDAHLLRELERRVRRRRAGEGARASVVRRAAP